MKKKISVVLCMITFVFSIHTVYAEGLEVNESANTIIGSNEIADELGGEVITLDEVPEGIIPIRFDSVEAAKEYLANEEALERHIYATAENNSNMVFADANTGVKSQTFYTGVGNVNVYAKYSYSNRKYTRVNSVTSSFTGVTLGNEWHQDTYSSSIGNNGKKLTVTVYGHFDHYILVKTILTKVGSEKKSYKASWSY